MVIDGVGQSGQRISAEGVIFIGSPQDNASIAEARAIAMELKLPLVIIPELLLP